MTASLCEENDIRPQEVERVETLVNWLETQYPSPAFANRREDGAPSPGSTHYYAAFGVVERGYPLLNRPPGEDDPPGVLEMMERVRIIPSREMGLFAPRVSIFTKERGVFTRQATGREFIFSFDELAERIGGIAPGAADTGDALQGNHRDLSRAGYRGKSGKAHPPHRGGGVRSAPPDKLQLHRTSCIERTTHEVSGLLKRSDK